MFTDCRRHSMSRRRWGGPTWSSWIDKVVNLGINLNYKTLLKIGASTLIIYFYKTFSLRASCIFFPTKHVTHQVAKFRDVCVRARFIKVDRVKLVRHTASRVGVVMKFRARKIPPQRHSSNGHQSALGDVRPSSASVEKGKTSSSDSSCNKFRKVHY